MMRKLRDMRWEVMVLSLVLSMNVSAATLAWQSGAVGIVTYDPLPAQTASAATLARQCGAVGIVTYDPLPDPAAPEAYTRTTEVPVPYAWLKAHDSGVAHTYEAYEASAQATAANGRKVWECYVLGLDPEVATNDFRITSFQMKADGTPDLEHIVFDPPQAQWNVPATYKVKGAAMLEGPWGDVPAGGNPAYRFFKVEVVLP